MDNALHLPLRVWYRLNSAWVVFFTLMGALNWYVAYTFATTTWVNFKLFGCTGMTLLFILLQALYIARHTKETELMQEGM
jgi:intracellular septation protein